MVETIKGEKRTVARFRLEIPARIEVIDPVRKRETRELQTENISSAGAFFHTERPLPEGTPVKLDIVLPLHAVKRLKAGPKQAHIRLTGRVARSEEKGMAIAFNDDYTIRPMKEEKDKGWGLGKGGPP